MITSFSIEINIDLLYILIHSVKCSGADSPVSLLLLCTDLLLLIALSFILLPRKHKWKSLTPFCTYVNKVWSGEHCHKNLCNVNSFWDNSVNIAGRCGKWLNEHFSVPAAQLYAEEGVKQSYRLRATLAQDFNVQLTCMWKKWGTKIQL